MINNSNSIATLNGNTSVISDLEARADEFRIQGYTVIEGVLDASQIETAKAALDEIFEREREIGPEREWHNSTYKVAYMLPQKHALFRNICFGEKTLSLMRLLLGQRFVLGSLNGLSMTSGGINQPLHIDQEESVPGVILTINAMHILDDFTPENGSTRLIPGSQDRVWIHNANPEEFESETIQLQAPAGSLIAFNGGLWHAGSRNNTPHPRRVLHAFFHQPWVVPQWDYPRSLSPDVVEELSPEQKRLFGFKTRPKWYDSQQHRIMR
jgi:ectoine hydroxylase-related dioxygenase (phytanoyl-CoA dioxygenase family)